MTERRVLYTLRTMSGALLLTMGLMAMPALGDHPACNGAVGDCCADNGSPGCDDADCCHAVCDNDPFCCDVEWDGICAGSATDLCGEFCVSPPGEVPTNCVDEGNTQITQSTSGEIVVGTGVACAAQPFTTENFWCRTYLMDADLSITCATVGVEGNSGGAPHPAFIAVYLDTNGGEPDMGIFHKLLGQVDFDITTGGIYSGDFNPPINVLAGDQIIVELFVTDGTISNPLTGIWPGANALGQSGASYIKSVSCGISEYLDLAGIGFPLSHLVNAINGNAGGPPCLGDLDGSGEVNTVDMLILFAQWGTAGPADLDGNGTVNTVDLLILFANWGPC